METKESSKFNLTGFTVLIKDRQVINILQENKNKGIPHTSTAELALSDYLGVEFKRRRGARRPLPNFDYEKKSGILIALKAPELIIALVNLRDNEGISPAFAVENAITKRYGAAKAS
ncbi:MAG: hypothetical protein WCI51_07120 [Lentisphaerota bacterium]